MDTGFLSAGIQPGRPLPDSLVEEVHSPLLDCFLAGVRAATGLPVHLLSRNAAMIPGPMGNAFCAVPYNQETNTFPSNGVGIRNPQGGGSGRRAIGCAAGLVAGALPLMLIQRHSATLCIGPALVVMPNQGHFEQVLASFRDQWCDSDLLKARHVYFSMPVVAIARFEAIMDWLIVYLAGWAERIEPLVLTTSGTYSPVVSRSTRFIQDNLGESITARDVAFHLGVNHSWLCRLFIAEMKMTLTEYIAQIRVTKAREMLIDTTISATDIAMTVGFGSIRQFNDVFKRQAGTTPTQYRKMRKQAGPRIGDKG